MNATSDSGVANHKHCVFCGETSNNSGVSAPCLSPQNYLTADTVGNKPHAYPMTIQERAKIAAARARENFKPSDLGYISTSDFGWLNHTKRMTVVRANETRSDILKSE